jgi:capsular polysaccharide biosynthesis protein
MSNDHGGGIPWAVLVWTLRRFWWVILGAALAAGLLTTYWLGTVKPLYQSEARLLVGPLTGSTDSLRASASLGLTYQDALSSTSGLRRVATEVGIGPLTDAELASAVNVAFNEKSRILTVQGIWYDAATAQKLTNLTVDEVTHIKAQVPDSDSVDNPTSDVQQLLNTRRSSGEVTVIQPATLPKDPTGSAGDVLALLAALLGGLLAFVVAVFWAHRKQQHAAKVRSAVAVRDILGNPAAIRTRKGIGVPAAPGIARGSRAREYGEIAARAEIRAPVDYLTSLFVVGTGGQGCDGEVALNLALAFAYTGRNVRLVDAAGDLDASKFDEPGLQVHTAPNAPQDWAPEALADAATARPDELLLLRLPSVTAIGSGFGGYVAADGVILVASQESPSVEVNIADACEAIVRRGGRVLGVVLVRGGGPVARLTEVPDSSVYL